MRRPLINILGAVATIGVLALGILLIAVPIGFQALGVLGQTATVAQSNSVYQAQIDGLRKEEERLDEIEASVAGLEAQITPQNELDDVFEVIAKAARSSGVALTSVTTADPALFSPRTTAAALGVAAEAPSTDAGEAQPEESPQDSATADTSTPTGGASQAAGGAVVPPVGRTQVDVTMQVTATDMGQVVAFLDDLRNGPRLLSQVQTTVEPTGSGFSVQVTGSTFVLNEEG